MKEETAVVPELEAKCDHMADVNDGNDEQLKEWVKQVLWSNVMWTFWPKINKKQRARIQFVRNPMDN